MPQFRRQYEFNYERVVSGLRLILWGMFKKLVIADRLAVFVNAVYGQPSAYGALPTIVATYFFAFQIYCDFSGYSDIAVGSARVLGYDLTINFRSPYFAQTIQDFWRRWHISLSTWLRDYLYLPLGGRRVATPVWILNILTVFLISGLWHGASWTFCVWGLLHGIYYVGFAFTGSLRKRLTEFFRFAPEGLTLKIIKICITFNLVAFAWIFFRASRISDALQLLSALAGFNSGPAVIHSPLALITGAGLLLNCFLILVLITAELVARGNIESYWSSRHLTVRWAVSYCFLFAILTLGTVSKNEFIYFQF